MELLYQLGLAIIVWLQQTFPSLVGVSRLISALGEEPVYLVVLPILYWIVDKRLGRQVGYIFLLTAAINQMLKGLLHEPRPFWIDPSVQLGEAEGYAFPSGHVQYATSIFLLLAAAARRSWAWVLALAYIGLMAFSRVYLGVHFPHDVVGGFVLGLLVLALMGLWQYRFAAGFNKAILGRRLFILAAIPLILAAVYVALRLVLPAPDQTVPWAARIPAANLDAQKNVVSTVAGLLGFGLGVMLESSRVRFQVSGPWWQRAARYLLGIAVAVGLWAGLDAAFPSEPAVVALPLRFIRYFVLLLWVSYFAPWLFVRLRLAATSAESEFRVTL